MFVAVFAGLCLRGCAVFVAVFAVMFVAVFAGLCCVCGSVCGGVCGAVALGPFRGGAARGRCGAGARARRVR